MTLRNIEKTEEILETPLQLNTLHPEELLLLLRKYAPHSLKQKEAKQVFKELLEYLTKEEETRIFESWETIHSDPGEFYSVIHELLYKYGRNNK